MHHLRCLLLQLFFGLSIIVAAPQDSPGHLPIRWFQLVRQRVYSPGGATLTCRRRIHHSMIDLSGVRTVLRLLGRDRTPGHTIFLAITVMMERRVVRKQPGLEAYWCNIILHFFRHARSWEWVASISNHCQNASDEHVIMAAASARRWRKHCIFFPVASRQWRKHWIYNKQIPPCIYKAPHAYTRPPRPLHIQDPPLHIQDPMFY